MLKKLRIVNQVLNMSARFVKAKTLFANVAVRGALLVRTVIILPIVSSVKIFSITLSCVMFVSLSQDKQTSRPDVTQRT